MMTSFRSRLRSEMLRAEARHPILDTAALRVPKLRRAFRSGQCPLRNTDRGVAGPAVVMNLPDMSPLLAFWQRLVDTGKPVG